MNDSVNTHIHYIGTTLGEAVQEIAETMLFVEIEAGLITTDQCDIELDYCAIIDFGGSFQGCFCLVATSRAAIKLASALLGEERLEMDEEMADSFGEVANMVAGGFVSRVESRYGAVSMTPPDLIQSGDHPLANEKEWLRVHHGFELDGLPFCAEIYVAPDCVEALLAK